MKCANCTQQRLFLMASAGKILQCRNCGFKQDFFEPDYSDYHDEKYSYSFTRNKSNDPLLAETIRQLAPISKKEIVLDYGCGAGDYALAISKLSDYVIGMDLNISFAKKRSNKIKWIKKDSSTTIPLEDASVDKIIAVNVIEHIHDFENQMEEFKRVLKPKGKIFITTFDTNYILHSIHFDETHLYEWNNAEFTHFVSQYFKVENNFSSGSFFNYYPLNKIILKFIKPELCVVGSKDNL